MKKYMAPRLEVFELELNTVLAASATQEIGFGGAYDGSAEIEKGGRGRAWRDYEGR